MSELNQLPTLATTIAAHGLSTKKSLGQHFLLDANILRRVAAYAGDVKSYTVVEIGPGPGGLTRAILEAGAKQMIVIEKDERCLPILEHIRSLVGDRLIILNEDALNYNAQKTLAPRKIISNLPYNIGTELLIRWLDDVYRYGVSAYASMTLMFQKEVAERITANPGSKAYGRLSVLAQWLCDVRYDMELPSGAFSPPPKVSSAVITLIPRERPLVDVKKETLERVMLAAFGQRRKMLRASLKTLHPDTEIWLRQAEIEPTARAETIDVTRLCRLAALLK